MAERWLGKYRLISQIAVGGMAEVYQAAIGGVEGFEKQIALKVILPNFAADPEFVRMLIDEAKLAVRLQHANIVATYDLGKVEDKYYIAMELVDGTDLFRILRRTADRGQHLPFDAAAFVAGEVCEGLDYAHRRTDANGRSLRLVHRDVSPQNVLISFGGAVKLCDFGIAKATQRENYTAVGVIKGKYYYMSPEQAWADPVDARSDIFSAGIILWEMLAGEMLYNISDTNQLLEAVRRADIPPPSSRRPDVPRDLEAIALRAMRKRPGDRWQSAGEMSHALQTWMRRSAADFTPARLGALVSGAVDREKDGAPVAPPKPKPEPVAPQPRDAAQETSEFDAVPDQNSLIFDWPPESTQERTRLRDLPPLLDLPAAHEADDGDATTSEGKAMAAKVAEPTDQSASPAEEEDDEEDGTDEHTAVDQDSIPPLTFDDTTTVDRRAVSAGPARPGLPSSVGSLAELAAQSKAPDRKAAPAPSALGAMDDEAGTSVRTQSPPPRPPSLVAPVGKPPPLAFDADDTDTAEVGPATLFDPDELLSRELGRGRMPDVGAHAKAPAKVAAKSLGPPPARPATRAPEGAASKVVVKAPASAPARVVVKAPEKASGKPVAKAPEPSPAKAAARAPSRVPTKALPMLARPGIADGDEPPTNISAERGPAAGGRPITEDDAATNVPSAKFRLATGGDSLTGDDEATNVPAEKRGSGLHRPTLGEDDEDRSTISPGDILQSVDEHPGLGEDDEDRSTISPHDILQAGPERPRLGQDEEDSSAAPPPRRPAAPAVPVPVRPEPSAPARRVDSNVWAMPYRTDEKGDPASFSSSVPTAVAGQERLGGAGRAGTGSTDLDAIPTQVGYIPPAHDVMPEPPPRETTPSNVDLSFERPRAGLLPWIVVGIGTIAAVAGLLTLLLWPESPQRGGIDVISYPIGAQVRVDATEVRGLTPVRVEGVNPQRPHRVVVRYPGYQNWERDVSFEPGRTNLELHVVLTPLKARLNITSDPPGATVLIHGQPRGRTPVTLDDLPSDQEVVFELRLDGYKPERRHLGWQGAREQRIEVSLEKIAPDRPARPR